MATDGQIKYEMIVDNNGAVTSMKKLEKQTDTTAKNMQKSMSKSGLEMTKSVAGFAAAGIAGLGALGAATTDYIGKQNMVMAAYGDMTKEAESWAKSIGGMLAVPTSDMLKYGASMTLTAQNYGMNEEAAVKYGGAVTTLSGIISSYLGLPMADVSERISAAMRGEAESAEALGLTLNETAVQNYALAQGCETAWKDMSDQEKMTWRLYTAIDQVANMMGVEVEAVNSTSSAIAALTEMTEVASTQTTNFQKTVAALKDAFMVFLDAMAPVMDKIFGLILELGALVGMITSKVIPILQDLTQGFKNFLYTIQNLITTFPAFFKVLGFLAVLFGVITAAVMAGNKAYGLMVKAYKAITAFPKVISNLTGKWIENTKQLGLNIGKMVDHTKGMLKSIKTTIVSIVTKIKDNETLREQAKVLRDAGKAFMENTKAMIKNIGSTIVKIGSTIKSTAATIKDWIVTKAHTIATRANSIAKGIGSKMNIFGKKTTDDHTKGLDNNGKALDNNKSKVDKWIKMFIPGVKWVAIGIGVVKGLSAGLDFLAENYDSLGPIMQGFADFCFTVQNAIQPLVDWVNWLVDSLGNLADALTPFGALGGGLGGGGSWNSSATAAASMSAGAGAIHNQNNSAIFKLNIPVNVEGGGQTNFYKEIMHQW